MKYIPTKQRLSLVVAGVALVGILIYPASLIALIFGMALGYHGCKQHTQRREGVYP